MLRDYAATPEYQKLAGDRSKAYIFSYFLTCAYIGLFSDWGFGLWWLAVIPIGMFAVSLLFAAPFTVLETYLRLKGVLIIPSLIGLVGFFGVYPAAYFGLKATHGLLF
jgi:hypothetical protein